MKKWAVLIILAALLWGSAQALKGAEIPEGASEATLTFRSLNAKEAEELAEILAANPSLRECDLSGTAIPLAAAQTLMTRCPEIRFHLTIDLRGGIRVDNRLTRLDMDATRSENKTQLSRRLKMEDLRVLLDCMPDLTEVCMADALHPLAEMESLIADYPRISFTWSVRVNGMGFRAGATAYSTLKGRQEPRYTAEDLEPVIRYCPDLLALDVGHNNVSDLSFLKAWPKLRRLIVIDSKTPVTDISPLAELEDLEYVELFMQNITDISPLAGKTRLLDLNLCHNDITDLTPLYSCVNLQRLWISANPRLTQEEIDRFHEAVPLCQIERLDWQSTGSGWRTHPRYRIMYDSFVSGVYEPFETPAPPEPEPVMLPLAEPDAPGTPARDISLDCEYNGRPGKGHNLTDGGYSRDFTTGFWENTHGLEIKAPEGEVIGAVYIQWHYQPQALYIQARGEDGAWVTVGQCDGDFYAQYIRTPALNDLMLVCKEDPHRPMTICEMRVLTPGEPPEGIQLWQKPGDKVDMMMLVGHPDDEVLWFGGALPYYAGEQGKNVLVVCAAMNRSIRRLELLDCLWACGVRTHPVHCMFVDFTTRDKDQVFLEWGGQAKLLETFTEYYRQYRPDVVLLHDVKGEYGHGIHQTMCWLGQQCAELAADASAYPEQVQKYGTWNIPKIYIHLYPENQIRMDWHRPLSAFGGKTAIEIAMDAMTMHRTQLPHGWRVEDGGEMDNALYGLYRTLVGEDVRKDDFFENIPDPVGEIRGSSLPENP